MGQSQTETEIKLPLPDREALLARLPGLGFRLSTARQFEANTLYDSPDARLRGQGQILRIRQNGADGPESRWVLTYKGPAASGKHKSREELETTLGDGAMVALVLQRLGYQPTFRYEKYRTEFTDGEGVLTVDETPIGEYMELEGDAAWIDRQAAALGYSESQYITRSYGGLYLDHCAVAGITPAHMVFGRSPEAP
jgi:adenylate cyclase, class 2